MGRILFILSFLVSNFGLSQTIEWTNPNGFLFVNYDAAYGEDQYSIVLYLHNDSIKQFSIMDINVGEEYKDSNPLTFAKFLENIEENLARCPSCVMRYGERFVDVSRRTEKPLENAPVVTVHILFDNSLGVKELKLPTEAQFRYYRYVYVDYEFREIK